MIPAYQLATISKGLIYIISLSLSLMFEYFVAWYLLLPFASRSVNSLIYSRHIKTIFQRIT